MSIKNLMKGIKDTVNIGHIISIVIFLFAIGGSWLTTYFTIKFTGQNNTNQIAKLNQKVQTTNDKIENLDNIYVRQTEFNQYKDNTNNKLDNISDNVNYLIRLQIQTNKPN